jgi:hypothetical protein
LVGHKSQSEMKFGKPRGKHERVGPLLQRLQIRTQR